MDNMSNKISTMDKLSHIVNRVKKIRIAMFGEGHGAVAKFADFLNLNYQTYRHYEEDRTNLEILMLIHKKLQLSYHWLITGEGEKRISQPGGPQAERISEHPELYGMTGYPYSPDERHYIGLLTEILRGKNQKNAKAIKENIEAFHYSKDLSPAQTGDRVSADCPAPAPKKTAENGK